jgi:hypothetical protein
LFICLSVQLTDNRSDRPYFDHRCRDVIVLRQFSVQLLRELGYFLLGVTFRDECLELLVSGDKWIAHPNHVNTSRSRVAASSSSVNRQLPSR